jgi:putative phosphoesterase
VKIAVISDTHLPTPTPWLEKVFAEYLQDADLLMHCGDITGEQTLAWLDASHPNFLPVAGNMDAHTLPHLPGARRFEYRGLHIGLAHGYGFKGGMAAKLHRDFGPGLDLICFGHTHVYEFTRLDTTWMCNPGSLQEHAPSLAWIFSGNAGELRAQQVVPSV